MKRCFKILISLLIICLVLFSLCVYATNNDYITALKETADNYYYRTNYIHYDSQPVTYQLGNFYKTRNYNMFSPEEATEGVMKFSVCSHFVNSIYYETFVNNNGEHYKMTGKYYNNNEIVTGELNDTRKMMDTAEIEFKNGNTGSGELVVCYYEFPGYDGSGDYSKAKRTSFINNNIISILKPGDLVVYRYQSGKKSSILGHVAIFLNNNLEYEVMGTDYNLREKRSSWTSVNAVHKGDINYLISRPKNPGKILSSGDSGDEEQSGLIRYDAFAICVLRPLNQISDDYTLTSNANFRINAVGLRATKTASVGTYQSVNLGDTIRYTINVSNSGDNTISNIIIKEKIPSNTELISYPNATYDDIDELCWTIGSLSSNSEKNYWYEVRVKDDNSQLGKYVESNNGSIIVNNKVISLNSINTLINNTLSAEDIEYIKQNVHENDSFSSTGKFLNTIYNYNFSSIGGISGDTSGDVDMIFNKYFNHITVTSGINKTYLEKAYGSGNVNSINAFVLKDDNSIYKSMYVNGLFGGLFVIPYKDTIPNTVDRYDGRNLWYTCNTFTVGDILVLSTDRDANNNGEAYLAGKKNMYLYIGDNQFATVENGKVRIISGSKRYKLTDNSSNFNISTAERLLDSIIGQSACIVLRPSFVTTTKNHTDNNGNFLVTQSGSTQTFLTLKNAYDSITNNTGTIIVSGDVIDNSSITIDSSKNITINTNGYTLFRNSSPIVNNGTLRITGNGSIESNDNKLLNIINNSGDLIIDKNTSIINYGTDSNNQYYAIQSRHGTVQTSGNVKAIANNSLAIYITGNTELILKDGLVYSSNGTAINAKSGDSTVITIGTADDTVYTNKPEIIGKIGVSTISTFNFYDGIINGSLNPVYGGLSRITQIPNDYYVLYSSKTIDGIKYDSVYLDDSVNFKVGNKNYKTLVDAYNGIVKLDNSGINGEIVVENDSFDDNSNLTIDAGKIITINTNNKTIIRSGNTIKNNGTLIVSGKGAISTDKDNNNSLFNIINNKGNLFIDTGTSVINYGSDSSKTYYAIQSSTGEVTIKGLVKSIANKTLGIYITGDTILKIEDGIVLSSNGTAINAKAGDSTTITIGNDDELISTSIPEIIGNNGVSTSSTFNFYDGILKGKTNAIYGGISRVTNTPENYVVVTGTEDISGESYKTAFLQLKEVYMRGDVNYDGELTIVDVRILLQKVINESYTEDEMDVVDFNEDGNVSIIDVRTLLQYIINH